MGDAFKKVQAGQRIAILADAFNGFVDAAQAVREHKQFGTEASQFFRQTGIIKVKNQSGADRERFDILGASIPIILPNENLQEFKNRVKLAGVVPTTDHLGEFLILLEPLKAVVIGRGIVAGVSLARLLVNPVGQRPSGPALRLQAADPALVSGRRRDRSIHVAAAQAPRCRVRRCPSAGERTPVPHPVADRTGSSSENTKTPFASNSWPFSAPCYAVPCEALGKWEAQFLGALRLALTR